MLLKKEIQSEALVRNVEAYARFLDLAATISGQVINNNSLASDGDIPKELLHRFFDLL